MTVIRVFGGQVGPMPRKYECGLKGRNARRRCHAYVEQEGKCYYCGELMFFASTPGGGSQDPKLCTLEHLDDRTNPWRGMSGHSRTVAACYACNQEKGREAMFDARAKRARKL